MITNISLGLIELSILLEFQVRNRNGCNYFGDGERAEERQEDAEKKQHKTKQVREKAV